MKSKLAIITIALGTCLTTTLSFANTAKRPETYKPATIGCVIEAAQSYKIPPALMLAVASVEGGKNGTASRNKNTTYDIGHFQLNTMHWKKGGFFSDTDMGEARWNGCYNAKLASRLMRYQLDLHGKKDFWTAAAAYHSVTPRHNARYRRLLQKKTYEWQAWLNQVGKVCAARSNKASPCKVAYVPPKRQVVRR